MNQCKQFQKAMKSGKSMGKCNVATGPKFR